MRRETSPLFSLNHSQRARSWLHAVVLLGAGSPDPKATSTNLVFQPLGVVCANPGRIRPVHGFCCVCGQNDDRAALATVQRVLHATLRPAPRANDQMAELIGTLPPFGLVRRSKRV
jgi:hypothetical protein